MPTSSMRILVVMPTSSMRILEVIPSSIVQTLLVMPTSMVRVFLMMPTSMVRTLVVIPFFSKAKFDRVDFLNTSFTKVSLYEADFDSMKVNWSSFKKPLVETNPQSFDGLTYVKLIKNFRMLEQFDDADDAYFCYRFGSLTGIDDVFMLLSCGFGVIPYLPLIWGLFIVLLFAGFYKRGNGIRRLKENDEDDSRVSYGDALYFSIVTFTTVGFGDWYPVDRYRKAAVVIEGLMGWLTLALFLVTLANVMIRP